MSFENRYSTLDRLLHKLAFATAPIQVAVADMEDQFFASQLEPIEIHRPVFVTALPRAGTTLLLEAIEALPEFASHTYRNMPFVLCPLLWNRFSSGFRRSGEAQERAHQDGMLVTADSPEAFEEMLWKAFWKRHYEKDRIRPWQESDTEFFDFLRSHMRKIVALSEPKTDAMPRYLSKNNLNIARVGILAENFPDAAIVVPFREPLQHAASLLRQHKNFLDIHKQDRFAREYMAGIGHFDFGENLRPVDFNAWLDRATAAEPTTIGFWLEYWIATYSHLADQDGIHLLCYEDLCAAPVDSLQHLARILQLQDPAALLNVALRIEARQPHAVTTDSAIQEVVDQSHDLYQRLRSRAGGQSAE
ncbi:MAG: sulfotransferase [Woeseiaceae bacterium]